MTWRNKAWDEKDFSKNHFTPEQFEASVRKAMATADDYVWIYTRRRAGGRTPTANRRNSRRNTTRPSAALLDNDHMPQEKTATIRLNTDNVVGEVSPNIFGGFAEHMGRCIYGGIYDPQSPHADQQGFRKDVIAALREMRMPVLRYPGGNFVNTYEWLDGVGPERSAAAPPRARVALDRGESVRGRTNSSNSAARSAVSDAGGQPRHARL
jgi:hypothetical protein